MSEHEQPFPDATRYKRFIESGQMFEDNSDVVDRASLDSFPASDPPSWSGVRLGSPRNAEITPGLTEG